MANAIANYLIFVGSDLRIRGKERLQALVDAAVQYGEFILVQAQGVGTAASPNRASIYGGFQFGTWVQQCQAFSDDLASRGEKLRRRPPRPLIWVVEGYSEERFFRYLLRERHGSDFVGSRLINLYGIGGLRNLGALLRQKTEDGYEPLILTDRDEGKYHRHIRNLIERRVLKSRNVIRFRVDFETAFPDELLGSSFEGVLGPKRRPEIATALRRIRRRGTAGFTKELKSALVRRGVSAVDAKRIVDGAKLRAADHLARTVGHHLNAILFRTGPGPEIIRIVRRFVTDTMDYGIAQRRKRIAVRTDDEVVSDV